MLQRYPFDLDSIESSGRARKGMLWIGDSFKADAAAEPSVTRMLKKGWGSDRPESALCQMCHI